MTALPTSVDLVGHGDREFGPEEGARVLAARPARQDLAPDPDLPADTRPGRRAIPPATLEDLLPGEAQALERLE